MPTAYFQADEPVQALVTSAVSQWHQRLKTTRFGVLFANIVSGDEDKESAEAARSVKEHGHPVLGTVKLVSPKDRVSKGFEVEMVLDGDNWSALGLQKQMALLDHLISRVGVRTRKVKQKRVPGAPKPPDQYEDVLDASGRPLLKLLKGDWAGGVGFIDVAKRHGDDAPECVAVDAGRTIFGGP